MRLRDWLDPDAAFSAEDRQYFADCRAETNGPRSKLLAGLLLVGSVASAIAHWMSAPGAPTNQLRRDTLPVSYALDISVSLVVLLVGASSSPKLATLRRYSAEALAVVLVLSGAAASALAQYGSGSLHEWTMAAVVPAALLFVRIEILSLSYVISALIVLPAVWLLRPGDPERLTSTVVLLAFVTAMIAVSRALWRQQVHEAAVRLDFERLSLSLDSQVQAQLSELNAHTAEVERLNTVLAERVRETSRELAAALARLSRGEGPSGALREGTVLGDRVTIEQVLGRGGMGIVYQGWDQLTESTVAVKVVHARSEDELDTMFRTLREAEAIATLRHPAIVRTEHVGLSDDGHLYIVLELVEGRTLSEAMASDATWSQSRVARLGSILADALAQAHDSGVVHRDMKPENIMLIADTPGVKLLDFGLAKLREQHDSAITSPEKILGTPEYLSPEQVIDPSTIGPATDIYGLGLILYRLLCACAPYSANSASEWIARHAFAKPILLKQMLPTVDVSINDMIMRCLEKNPTDRPSAAELRVFFSAFADSAHEPPIEVSELARGSRRRSRPTPSASRASVRREKA